MTDTPDRDVYRRLLRDRVGGFFHNTRHEPGVTCVVCRGPAPDGLCGPCSLHEERFPKRLADLVLTLAYVRANAPVYHQSAYAMRAYKAVPPSAKAVQDLALMVLAATQLHAACAARTVGSPWTAVTFVPSSSRPGPEHPAAGLARAASGDRPQQRFLLGVGPGIDVPGREVLEDRFVVPADSARQVAGAHVLVVDDTWTSGSKVQSAALALTTAGASHVTVLCVARWCRHDWPDHRALLDRYPDPYDAAVCPVTGQSCPG